MIDIGQEVQDLYDHERAALRDVKNILLRKHSFKGVKTIDQEEAIQRAFTHEAVSRCAEIGLVIDVLWHWDTYTCTGCRVKFDEATSICSTCGGEVVRKGSPDCSDDEDDQNLYWNPALVVTGRTEKLNGFDHDRQRHEVKSGLLDGIKGEIRENGEFREDLRKQSY